MKKIIFTLLLPVLFLARINAQNLIITPSDSVFNIDTTTSSTDGFYQYISVLNNGPDTVTFLWHLASDTIPGHIDTLGWTPDFCDNHNCYSLPATHTSDPVPPGDSISMHSLISPNCNPGTGTFTISARVTNYDTTLTFTYTLQVYSTCSSSVGINDVKGRLNLSVYPNPAVDVINLTGMEAGHEINVQLMDVSGRILSSTNSVSRETYSCDISNLPGGLYFVTVRDNETHLAATAKFTRF